MHAVTVYDKRTGEIRTTGTTSDYSNYLDEGYGVIEQPAPNLQGYYVDVRVVPPVIRAKPPRPSEDYAFDYATREWVFDSESAARRVRRRRDMLIARSDWTQLPDVPIGVREQWREYRRALRDVPQQPGFPLNVVWPEAPG